MFETTTGNEPAVGVNPHSFEKTDSLGRRLNKLGRPKTNLLLSSLQMDFMAVLQDAIDAGITRIEIAARTGYTISHIEKIASGRARGSLDSWSKILESIGAEVVIKHEEVNST